MRVNHFWRQTIVRLLNKMRSYIVLMLCLYALLLGVTQAVAETSASLQNVKFLNLPPNRFQAEFSFSTPLKEQPTSFLTTKPDRLIFDFKNVSDRLSQNQQTVNKFGITTFTAIEAEGRTRVIFDLQRPISFQTQIVGNNLNVVFDAVKVSKVKTSKTATATITQNSVTNSANTAASTTTPEITNIEFRKGKDNQAQVIVDMSRSDIGVDLHKSNGDLIAEFIGTQIKPNVNTKMSVNDQGTPIQNIEVTNTGKNTQLKLTTQGNYQHLAYQVNKQYIIEIKPILPKVKSLEGNKVTNPLDTPGYTGEKLSLNFQDIKVRAVLQLIAEFTGLNIVTSDTIRSSVTLRLQNVPWNQALDIILKTQGLDKRQIGNVLLIAPSEEIAAHEKQELLAKQQVENLVPLKSELIQINYGKATDIASLLKDKSNTLLSARGAVSVDTRTNTIWVQDISDKLIEIRKLIRKLDIPVRQVLIEARIVNVDSSFERDLGIKFGLTQPPNVSGTLQGANDIILGGGNDKMSLSNVDPTERLNLSLPATPATGTTTPATLGIALARITNNIFLDMELSALESEGAGEVISNPRLVTANQQAAFIESGEEIPYQEATSSGATNVAFKKAVLSLKVTPQITPDGKIILDLKVNQDSRGQVTNGVPAINTKQMETQVLVSNGETIVLGGIYEQTKKNQIQRVPFFGTLPILGSLFRQRQNINNRTELLIFVTPKIIKQTAFAE